MARVKLDLPDEFSFKTSLSVRISDINYGGHLGNDAVLGLLHEVRFQFLNSLGYSNELDLENNTGLIVADAIIVYRAEAFHGDRLTAYIAVEDFNPYGFDLFYVLKETDSGKEITRAKTGIVCMNYTEKKLSKVPEEFIRKVKELEGYPI